jgi:hypothetical protein
VDDGEPLDWKNGKNINKGVTKFAQIRLAQCSFNVQLSFSVTLTKMSVLEAR